MQRPLAKRLWYGFLHVVCRLFAVVVFQTRCTGRHFVPKSGGVFVLSNHQSHLDPVLIGLACDRRLNFLARESLFRFLPFRWLIQSLDAIPIDREGTGLAGLKETLKRLKRGEMVLIFPEGTRTYDGQVSALKPGFVAIARRAEVPLVPVALDGAFDAWPRSRFLPVRAVIHVAFASPLMPHDILHLDDHALVAEVEARIRGAYTIAQQGRLRASSSQPR